MEIDEENKEIDVVVATSQLSLAIGRQGQNVRLASKLIGYKINVTADEDEEQLSKEQLNRARKNRKRAEAEELQNKETQKNKKKQLRILSRKFLNLQLQRKHKQAMKRDLLGKRVNWLIQERLRTIQNP